MTREVFEKDLRIVDEIAIETGKYQQADYRAVNLSALVVKSLYWLSVAVWHLLNEAIRRKDGTETNRPNG